MVRQAALMIGGVVLVTLLLFVLNHGAKWFVLAFAAVITYIAISGVRRSKNW